MKYFIYNVTSDELSAEATSSHCFIKDGRIISLKRDKPELDEMIRKSMEDKE